LIERVSPTNPIPNQQTTTRGTHQPYNKSKTAIKPTHLNQMIQIPTFSKST